MGKYFKAVRPNGRDFYTDSVDYAALCGTGERLPELPGGECCGPGVYHASTVAAETLIDGEWPCRVFEVEGEPASEEGSKRGFRTLTVVRELDAHLALGPNGAAVAALVERAGGLTADEARELGAAWDAWDTWAAWDARDAAEAAAMYAARDAAEAAAMYAAEVAAGYAAMALAVRDLITPEQFE